MAETQSSSLTTPSPLSPIHPIHAYDPSRPITPPPRFSDVASAPRPYRRLPFGSDGHQDDDHEIHPDDVLPSYIVDSHLPTYDRIGIDRPLTPPSTTPLLTYHLRQQRTGLQILVPFGPSPHVSYRIMTRIGFKLLGKRKPVIVITRCSTRNHSLSTTLPTLPSPTGTDEDIAWIDFANDGKLPWMPKANLTIQPDSSPSSASDSSSTSSSSPPPTQLIRMCAPNFRDWRLPFPSSPTASTPRPYTWHLLTRPTLLELHPHPSSPSARSSLPVARFRHTPLGSRAANGAEVGVLEIYRLESWPQGPDVGAIVGSCATVMEHYRRMGRHMCGVREKAGEARAGSVV